MMFKKFTFLSLAVLLSFKPLPSAPSTSEALQNEYPVVILGSGIAALTAAVQVTQAGVQPLVIAGPMPGGIIIQSHSVQNWPGEVEITGSALADKLQHQAEARGVVFNPGEVVDIDVAHRPFTLTVKNRFDKNKLQTIKARTCIIAMGALPRLLNVPGEKENLFVNIFTCAPCDGLRYKDKTVAVIGGGDAALTEAHYLSNLAKKVYLIVRKDQFKTIQPKQKDAILAQPNIEVVYNATVEAFQKDEHGMVLSLATPAGAEELFVNGAFLAIGSIPNSQLFKGKLELDKDGYIVLKDQQETSVPGIFAAGDVSDKWFNQAMTAAGDATKAALQAQKKYFGKTVLTSTPVEAASLKEIGSIESLRSLLSSSDKPVVVYFYSKQCSPCRAFRSTYDQWVSQFQEKAVFAKVDGENNLDCFQAYHVRAVPTILVIEKGKIIHQAIGLDELLKLPSLLEKVPAKPGLKD